MIKPNFPNEDLKKDSQVMSFYQCFENPSIFESDLCQKCGGKCCKRNGCAFAIEDFDVITKKKYYAKIRTRSVYSCDF